MRETNSKEINNIAIHLLIRGLVQGVGFRPFISRLALRNGLKGYVKNIGGSEVEIWIEGNEQNIIEFLISLFNDKPPVALLEQVYLSVEDPRGYIDFIIDKSSVDVYARSNIPPDFAICRDCLDEIMDPGNRRYMYVFNSCAWCGPRFSMIYKVPYDRENTSMREYNLCSSCLNEYYDPNNIRRYHAQGISCGVDGPRIHLLDREFNVVETRDPVRDAAKLIDEGYIVALKGIGGYHIASLATNDDVVLKLRERKKRPSKPFAIMGLNTEVLKRLVYMSIEDEEQLTSPQAPILLLPKRPDSEVSKYVSPGLSHEGVFIAYSGLHYVLLNYTRDKFLIMTSGNIHGEPMCIDEQCARSRLSSIVDYFLIHDRDIVNRVDDSVLRKTGNHYVFLRRSRGYAPSWITINMELNGEFIAFGGDLSTAGGVGFEDKIILTQYVGDLDSFNAQRDLLRFLEFLVSNFHVGRSMKPMVIVDAHPRLYSRRLGMDYARNRSLKWIEVQHHYAHVLGAAVDNEISGEITGIAIDGVGWGIDNTIWGCEILLFNTYSYGFKRLASLSQLPLTSDIDIYNPGRLFVAYLTKRGLELGEILRDININDEKELIEYKYVHELVKTGRYIPASSTGRLLDIVSYILNNKIRRTYEGEPAIWLESVAWRGDLIDIDPFTISCNNGLYLLNYDNVIDWLIESRLKHDINTLARSFLYNFGYY
ncbi:MAG: carbamoyltransferase HypF, partial [Desulfurococcaceae archaeon]